MSHRQKHRHKARHRTHAVKPASIPKPMPLQAVPDASPPALFLPQPSDGRNADAADVGTQAGL